MPAGIYRSIRRSMIYFYIGNPNQNAFTMPMNDAASRAAPPISPPSTSGFANSWGALEGLQLPP